MPCPYFIPTDRFDDAAFVHPGRLPLGAAYRGYCGAPEHKGSVPTDEELKLACNLGYARNCSRLPRDRQADAVRFSIVQDRQGQISICYVSELNYLPVGYGTLQYDSLLQRWISLHPEVRTQALAECFLQSYLAKR
jgi:hypothetical protein